MAQAVDRQSFPRLPLAGAIALVAVTLALVAASRIAGPAPAAAPEAMAAMDLAFEDRAGGHIHVRNASTGALIDEIAPGEDGFLRGVLRGLARERRAHGIGAETPFRLERHAGGRLAVIDTATGRQIDLAAFGPTNQAAFARFFDTREASR